MHALGSMTGQDPTVEFSLHFRAGGDRQRQQIADTVGNWQHADSPSRVKSNNAGISLPFGNFDPSTLNSSKNSWTIPSGALSSKQTRKSHPFLHDGSETYVNRAVGVYSNRLEMSAMASAGVRGLKTLVKG
jgi:hypothetical protein